MPIPQDHHIALDIVRLKGPRGLQFLGSEVPIVFRLGILFRSEA